MLGRRKSREPDAGGAAVSGDGAAGLPEAGAVAAGGRADAFISYSRSDKEFVEKQLVAELEARGKNVWFDLDDIEGGADWRERLSTGIRGARAFVFVISPASVASEPCRDELAQAKGLGKPFVPIVRIDVPPEQVPEELERSHWIFLRETDPVDTHLDEVVKAVDADLDWRDKHNELTIQAHDWLARDKDKSALLRGGKLKEAEQWQADPSPHHESPTAEQAAFILAGRRAASRRQRILVGAVGLALVVALALAGFALLQRSQAISREKTATSLALASASADQLASHFDVSLLLSLEAYRRSPTLQAERSMISALEAARASGAHTILRGHRGPVNGVAFSSDGHTLATAGAGPSGEASGAVLLWDTRTHKQLGQIVTSREGPALGVTFSPDGHTLATEGDNTYGVDPGPVLLWDTRTPDKPGQPLAGRRELGNANGVAFSPDGHTLATVEYDGAVLLWDTRTPGKRDQLVSGNEGSVYGVAFSRDGQTLAAAGDHGTVRLLDTDTHRHLGQLLTGQHGIVNGVAFSRDGHTLAAAGADGTVRLLDLRAPIKPGRTLTGHQGPVHGVAFSPDGHTLAAAGTDGTVRLWDIHAPDQPRRPFAGRHSLLRVAFSPDGHTLASVGSDGTVLLWDTRTPSKPGQPLNGQQLPANGVAFSPDGQTLAIAGDRSLPDGTDEPSVHGIVRFWDVRTHEQQQAQPLIEAGSDTRFNDLAFSPDKHTLATAGTYEANGTVDLWDISAPDKILPFTYGQDSTPRDVAFSPSGHVLAVATDDETVLLWGLRTPDKPAQTLTGNHGLLRIAFSPDGSTLASAGDDGTVRLWDVRTHVQLGEPLKGRQGQIVGVAFSPDGRTLTAVRSDGTESLWEGILWHDRDDLTAQVCRLVVGNLTDSEWQKLAPGLPYRTTCSD